MNMDDDAPMSNEIMLHDFWDRTSELRIEGTEFLFIDTNGINYVGRIGHSADFGVKKIVSIRYIELDKYTNSSSTLSGSTCRSMVLDSFDDVLDNMTRIWTKIS